MSDLEHLNEALAGEHFGIAAYEAALGAGLLDEQTGEVAKSFQSDHQFHRAALTEQILSRGGTAVRALPSNDYAKEYPPLTTAAEIVAYAIELEAGAARASIASVALYEDRGLALLAAQIGGVEAQHWALLLAASGANPVPHPIIETDASNSATAA
jgi:hypothetical protein